MTITAAGFPGSVDKVQWADLVEFFGYEGAEGLAVTAAGGDRTVNVAAGKANVGGVLAVNDATMVIQAAANASSFTRIDRVILRANWGTNTLTLAIKPGTPGSNPQPPSLTQDPGNLWELKLAQLDVSPGQGAFLSGDITSESTPRERGFYQVANLDRAPDPDNGSLVWIPSDESLQVGTTDGYVELAHAREVPRPEHVSDGADLDFTSTTPQAGNPVCGMTFVAPESGEVFVTVGGDIEQTFNGGTTQLGYQLRSGSGIGSGTIIQDATVARSIRCGEAVNSGAPARLSANWRQLVGALTPGTTYNVRTMHWVGGAGGAAGGVRSRYLLVEPA